MPKNFPFSALRRFAARLAVGLALVLPALTVPTLGAEAVTPLVGVDWLKAHLNDPNLVVLDIRSAIDGGGAEGLRRPRTSRAACTATTTRPAGA